MKTVLSEIPASIRKTYEEYGFSKPLDTAVATRSADGWYAILLKDHGELYAVDFVPGWNGGWEVSNDYVGPFESIEAFKTERLSASFL